MYCQNIDGNVTDHDLVSMSNYNNICEKRLPSEPLKTNENYFQNFWVAVYVLDIKAKYNLLSL